MGGADGASKQETGKNDAKSEIEKMLNQQ